MRPAAAVAGGPARDLRPHGFRRLVVAVLALDVRALARDHVALLTVLLSVAGTAGVTALGLFRADQPGWSAWFPFIVAASLVGGPAGFGLLFGLLMVEETRTGVRDALAVTPAPPGLLLLVRTAVAAAWGFAWPLASVLLMNSTWRVLDLGVHEWLAVVSPLAVLTAACALLIPGLADDQVGALAVFKAVSFVTLFPLALFFVPDHADYRLLLLASPTGWIVQGYRAFAQNDPASGFRLALAGTIYGAGLLGFAVRHFRRRVYRLHL